MKTPSRKPARDFLLGCVTAFLVSSCGGGGGTDSAPPGTISYSVNSVSFNSPGVFADAPAAQVITGNVTGVTSGTVYVKVVANNAVPNSPNGLFTVTNMTITGDTGQATVAPAIPSSIGAGQFQGTIVVTACLNDPSCQTGQLAGSPRTIPVSYDIGAGVDGDTVTPRVVPANAAGSVILRGTGFGGATSVSFGTAAATSVTVVNDSEIDASYPALVAGTYPVKINSGSIADTASLVAVSPPAFGQTYIPYPAGVGGQNPGAIEYDPQRSALFIVMPGTTYANNILNFTLLRYAFDGTAWGAPAQVTIGGLDQVHLSSDGTELLALESPSDVEESMVELDPVTLAQTGVTNLYQVDLSAGFALANDGYAIVGLAHGSGYGQVYAYGTFSHTFSTMTEGGSGYPAASGNGAIVELGGNEFVSSSETFENSTAQTGVGTTADLSGDKFVNGDTVESQAGQVLGYLSTPFAVVNPAGTRAYGYTTDALSGAPTLSTFDLTATPSRSPPEYPVLGTPVVLPASCPSGSGACLLTITPDGGTVFIATPSGVIVQPVSP